MEERMARLEEMMARLVEQNDLRRPRRNLEPRGNFEDREEREERYDDRGLKIEIPDFDGAVGDPEVYLEWEKAIERYFEYKDTPEDRQYKLAKMKLVRSAGVWFDGIQKQRVREGRARIATWEKLKKYLRRKYVPANYKQTLYIKMSSLKQGKRAVQEYIREFEKLLVDCDMSEPDELKMGRFVGGLNDDLRNKLETYPNLSYEEACSLAAVFERQRKGVHTYEAPLKKDGSKTTWRRSPTPYPFKTSSSSSGTPLKTREAEKEKEVFKGKEAKDVICYRCNGFGHMQKDCPNKKAFSIREWKEIRSKPKHLMLVEIEEDDDLFAEGEDGEFAPYVEEPVTVEDDVSSEEGERLPPETQQSLVVRKRNLLYNAPDLKQHEQRENLFHTKCRVGEELCDVIIAVEAKLIALISAWLKN